MPRTTEPQGFTLVEVMVALTLGALIVLLAHAIFSSVSDAAARAVLVARDADRVGNRRAWLVRAFGSAEAGTAPARGFQGLRGLAAGEESDRIEFVTQVAPHGHTSAWHVRLCVDAARQLVALLRPAAAADTIATDTLVLADTIAAFGADYLLGLGASTHWVQEWVSPVSAPLAVRLRFRRPDGSADTLLVSIGPRG